MGGSRRTNGRADGLSTAVPNHHVADDRPEALLGHRVDDERAAGTSRVSGLRIKACPRDSAQPNGPKDGTAEPSIDEQWASASSGNRTNPKTHCRIRATTMSAKLFDSMNMTTAAGPPVVSSVADGGHSSLAGGECAHLRP